MNANSDNSLTCEINPPVISGCSDKEQTCFDSWFEDRPDVIKKMVVNTPPRHKYRLKTTGQHCSVFSYFEDGTVTISIEGHDDEFLSAMNNRIPVKVFGIDPDDLESIQEEQIRN